MLRFPPLAAHLSGNKIQTPPSSLAILSHPPDPFAFGRELQPYMFCSLNTCSSPSPREPLFSLALAWNGYSLRALPDSRFPFPLGFSLEVISLERPFLTKQLRLPLLYHLILFHHKICSCGQCILIINVFSVYVLFPDSVSALGAGAGA